jgi:calcineurin-like phosphoesterase family protein
MAMVWKHDTGSFIFFSSMDIVDKTFRRHQKSASNLIRRDLKTDLSFMAGNKDELVQTARNDYWGSGLSYEPVLV